MLIVVIVISYVRLPETWASSDQSFTGSRGFELIEIEGVVYV